MGWIRTQPRGFQKWSWPTSPTPRNPPNWPGVSSFGRPFLTKKSWWNFSLKFIQNAIWVKKFAPGSQKHLLCLIVPFLSFLRYAEISATLCDFLKILTCGSKIFKNRKSSKISKNIIFQHLLFFLLLFRQSRSSCPHLPNFVSQKFLGGWEVPHENWDFGFKCTDFNLSN